MKVLIVYVDCGEAELFLTNLTESEFSFLKSAHGKYIGHDDGTEAMYSIYYGIMDTYNEMVKDMENDGVDLKWKSRFIQDKIEGTKLTHRVKNVIMLGLS